MKLKFMVPKPLFHPSPKAFVYAQTDSPFCKKKLIRKKTVQLGENCIATVRFEIKNH